MIIPSQTLLCLFVCHYDILHKIFVSPSIKNIPFFTIWCGAYLTPARTNHEHPSDLSKTDDVQLYNFHGSLCPAAWLVHLSHSSSSHSSSYWCVLVLVLLMLLVLANQTH